MKNLLLTILLSILAITVFAQDEQFSTKNKKAIKAFIEGRKDYQIQKYDDAIKLSNKALEEDSLFLEADVLLGFIYQDINKPEVALNYFKKSVAINPNFQPTIFYDMGILDVKLSKYDEGAAYFKTFLSIGRGGPELQNMAKNYLADCNYGSWAIKHPVPFELKNMGPEINSELWEYFPTISADGQTFIFTRRLVDTMQMEGFQEDLYESDMVDGKWNKAFNMGYPLNTPHFNEGAPTLSADGRLLIYASEEPGGFGSTDLYYSVKQGKHWSQGRNLGPRINTRAWESQPCLSADGKSLYFVRGRKFEEPETFDIYVTTLTDSNYWTTPQRLSDSVNTHATESYPFIAADNQTLYFCSNGWPGMGGMDIFVSRRKSDGSWGTPKNLGYPINTSADETSIVVNPNGQLAYISSDRPGGFGGQDIYSFLLYDSIKPTPITYMKGMVYDAVTKQPLQANFNLIDLSTGVTTVRSNSSPYDGGFLVSIPLHKNYALNVAKKGYLFYSENFALHDSNATSVHPFMVNIPLQPIDTGATVVLKNIFFATNKFDLRPESEVELNKLVTFLQVNPTVKIEVGGHTDNVGTPQSNITLSNNRAKSVYDYLVAHGIAAERLRYKGYGQTKPIADNTSENGRALNRRTEMKIIAK